MKCGIHRLHEQCPWLQTRLCGGSQKDRQALSGSSHYSTQIYSTKQKLHVKLDYCIPTRQTNTTSACMKKMKENTIRRPESQLSDRWHSKTAESLLSVSGSGPDLASILSRSCMLCGSIVCGLMVLKHTEIQREAAKFM